MSDIDSAAEVMGVPAPIVERSARAWAAASGQSYEEVVAAWAGGQAGAVSQPAAAPAPPPADSEAEAPADTEEAAAPAPEPAVPAAAATAPAPAAAVAAPTPERVSPDEALGYPVVVTVPTAGITERTGFSIPAWLSALLLVVPAFALLYLAMGASAGCGDGTILRVDRVSGAMVNCDGSAFEGRGPAGGGVDFIAMGEQSYATCAGCHGPQGQGSGPFPALTGVITTFGACADHIEWVELGTAGFQAEGRPTYGDPGKPVGGAGQMPGFANSLSAEQLAAVVAFERVRIGGGNAEEVLADCGLTEGEEGAAEGGEGGTTDTTVTGGDGGTPDTTAGGDGGATETTAAPEASR